MAVKLQASDSPDSQDTRPSDTEQNFLEQSLQRGTRLLATLVQAARAARLEAEVAELEAALAEAHEGSPRRLQRCLARFEAADGLVLPQLVPDDAWQAVPASPVTTPAAAVDRAMPAAQELPQALQADGSRPLISEELRARGWESYLVHARRRLQQLQRACPQAFAAGDMLAPAELLHTASDAGILVETAGRSDDEATAAVMADATLASESQSAVAVNEADSNGADDMVGVPDDSHADEADAGDADSEHRSNAIVDAAPVELDLSAMKNLTRELEQAPAVTRPMLSGVSLSLVGHIALLAGLFLITLKQADEPASLGSQLVSAVASPEDVEITPQFETLEPIEMQLDDALEPSIDPSQLTPSEATALAEIEAAAASASPLLGASSDSAGSSPSAGAILSEAVGRQSGRAAGGRGSGHGPPAMASTGGKFFGAGAGGNFFCYVVDSSGSMRGAAWESAKAELVRSIGTLAENQRFYIVFFAKEVAAIPEPGGREPAAHGLAATKENIDHARRWIETVKLDRGGPPNDALELAIALEPDAIYLLTDGVTQVDVCGFLRERNRTSDIISGEQVRVPIHAIAYHSLDGQQLLRRLAQENNGQFHYVPAR